MIKYLEIKSSLLVPKGNHVIQIKDRKLRTIIILKYIYIIVLIEECRLRIKVDAKVLSESSTIRRSRKC